MYEIFLNWGKFVYLMAEEETILIAWVETGEIVQFFNTEWGALKKYITSFMMADQIIVYISPFGYHKYPCIRNHL